MTIQASTVGFSSRVVGGLVVAPNEPGSSTEAPQGLREPVVVLMSSFDGKPGPSVGANQMWTREGNTKPLPKLALVLLSMDRREAFLYGNSDGGFRAPSKPYSSEWFALRKGRLTCKGRSLVWSITLLRTLSCRP